MPTPDRRPPLTITPHPRNPRRTGPHTRAGSLPTPVARTNSPGPHFPGESIPAIQGNNVGVVVGEETPLEPTPARARPRPQTWSHPGTLLCLIELLEGGPD